jgi:hypothetical protein
MYGLRERPRPRPGTAVINPKTGRPSAIIPAAFSEEFDQPDYDAPPPSQRVLPGQRWDPTFGRGEQRRGGISSMGQNLRSLCESYGPDWTCKKLQSCLKTGELRSTDFSVKELAEAFLGEGWVKACNPYLNRRGGFQRHRSLLEADEGVDVSAFQDITGQIFFNRIKDGWLNATLVGEKLTDKFPTQLDGERVPWLGHIIDEGEPIHPGTEYPMTSFGERYVDTPRTQKWGMTVWLTKEMIFFDRTGQAMKSAGEVGWRLGYNKEKRILVVALGQVNSYKLNGTAYNTYLQAPQSVPAYVNAQSGTPLVDYTSVQTALTLASQILDPDTKNPLDGIEFKQLFVMPAGLFHARRLVAATEYWNTQPGFAASTTSPEGNIQMHSINPVGQLEILTSPIAYQLFTTTTLYNAQWTPLTAAQTNAYWWIGQFMRSFWYMENWPFTVVQAPPNNPREFDQDLVVGWKVSERGVPAVQDPRYVFQFWQN